jgi:hypothetical protein
MTKTELSRLQAILSARIIELEQPIRHRDGIRVERTADQPEEIQQASERALAVCNIDRNFSHLRNVRPALRRTQEGEIRSSRVREHEATTWKLVKQ